MVNLDLKAESKPQELILAYLQENASQTLAEKINNGVPIEKDGKQLISKKDLKGFMSYATGEAKKLAAKGENSACIEDNVVYGWAIHYFEEDSIEGTLYNADGTEYKPVTKAKPKPTVTPVKAEPQKPKVQQSSLFDMLTAETAENGDNSSISPPQPQFAVKTEERITPVISADKPQKEPAPLYLTYMQLVERYKGFLILLRLGDFYEAFNDHATTLATELDLTLTGRDCGLDERVPMVGIPFHAVDSYVNKLVELKYKVILAEDLDNVLEFKDIDDYEDPEPEELFEDEMRKFDSYVDEEPEELPTVSKIVGPTENDDEDDGTEILNAESAKAFDSEAICILSDLFDGEITLA